MIEVDKSVIISKLAAIFAIFTVFITNASAGEGEHVAPRTTEEVHEEAAHEAAEGDFEPTPMILHHIADDYVWHIAGDIFIPLPVILYDAEKGFDVFMSSSFGHHGEHVVNGYKYDHGKIIAVDGTTNATLLDIGGDDVFYDFSITKNVTAMLFSFLFCVLIFTGVARAYRKRGTGAPKGFQSFMEPLILFVRDDIAIPSIGKKHYKKYLPYLLTLFFFIWLNNLMGLVPIFPGAANVTGNLAVTFALALLSFILVVASGNKHYWGHILWPPGVPLVLELPLAAIEFVGIFTKPFALMIRLFANITAGHIIILSIISLIFILGPALGTAGAGGVGVIAVLFSVFMNLLELLVAALQAFIFTILTALFIGQAVEEPVHH